MGIVSYIQGKCITHRYEVKEERDCETGKFKFRPQLVTHDDVVWKTLEREDGNEFVVDGEIGKNSQAMWMLDLNHYINLTETCKVCVENQIYRADLHAYMVHTNKVIEEKDYEYNKYTERNYKDLMREYNTQVIDGDEKLKAYCAVHKLDPAETDCDELKKVVYGDKSMQEIKADYVFNNGFMV